MRRTAEILRSINNTMNSRVINAICLISNWVKEPPSSYTEDGVVCWESEDWDISLNLKEKALTVKDTSGKLDCMLYFALAGLAQSIEYEAGMF